MAYVEIERKSDGFGPNEVLVEISTLNGIEEVFLDRGLLHGNLLDVGFPIQKRDDAYMVELPRESTKGSWRVWVNANSVRLQAAA